MGLRSIVAAAAATATLAGCAGTPPPNDRPEGAADAKVVVGKRHFSVWFRRQDTTLLLERGKSGAAQAIVSTLTLNAVTVTAPMPYWRAAAQAVLTPLGCSVVDVHPLDNQSRWEASYACPVGTNIAHEVERNREVWREGVLLPDPTSGAPP